MQNIFSTKARRTNLAATIQLVPFVYASVTEKRNVASVCIEKNQHIETHLGKVSEFFSAGTRFSKEHAFPGHLIANKKTH